MAVETAVVAKLSADDREFIAGMFRAQQAAQNMGTSVAVSQTKMAAMAGAIGGIASTVGMSFMQMSKSAASFAFNTVADFEQTRIGFEGIMGSAESAKTMLDELQAFAATTPFEFTELATSTKQLLAIGYAAGDVIPMMTKLGDATANLGLSQDAMKATIRALGQIKGMGRPLTQDLYQISNALPGFNPFDAIAKGVGKTQAETRKMIEQGLIPADQAINAILTGMQNMPGAAGAMQRQVDTIRGQMSNLADTIKIQLIKGFSDTGPAVNALKGLVAGVGPAMASTFAAVGAVMSALAPLFSTFGSILSAVFAVLKPFAAILGGAFMVAMKGFEAVLNVVMAPIQALANFIRANATAVSILTAAVGLLVIAWNASTIATKVNTVATAAWSFITTAATTVAAIFRDGLVALNIIMAQNPAVVWIAAIGALIALFVLAWQKSETFREVVTAVFDFVAKIVGKAIGFILKTVGRFLLAYADLYDANGLLGTVISTVWNFIGKLILGAIGGILKIYGKYLQAISDLMDSQGFLGKIIATVFNFIWSTIGKVVGGVLGFFGKWLTNIADFILGNKDAVNTLVKIFTFIPNTIGNVVKGVLGFLKAMLSGIGSLVSGAADKIASLGETFANLLDKIPGMGGIANAMRSAAQGVRNAGNLIESGLDSVGNKIQSVINGVSNFQEKLVDPGTYTGLVKGIKKVGETLTNVSEKAFEISEIKMGDQIVNTISNAIGKVGKFVEGMGDKVLSWTELDLGTSLLNGLTAVARKVGNTMVDMGSLVESYTAEGFTGKVANAVGDTIDFIKQKLGLGTAADVVEKANKDYVNAITDPVVDPAADIAKQADTMAKVRDSMKKGIDAVQGVLDDLQKAAGDFAKSLKDSITGFAGLGGIELPDGFIPQAKSLIKNMELRLKKSQDFTSQIASLQQMGLNTASLKTLLEEGPIKGAQLAASILSGGQQAINQINALESQITAVGAGLGAIGKESIYGADIATAQSFVAQYTPDGTTAETRGNNVVISDGAFRAVINISGAATPEEQVQLIQQGIEDKFNELARALAAKTG